MKIHCCHTPAHEVLFRRHFLPSLPPRFVVEAHPLAISGAGDFLSREFLRCIREKIALIRQSIAADPGALIVWSDVDIVFRGDAVEAVERAFAADPGLKLLFQREAKHLPDVNTGFVALRCGPETAAFFEEIARRLEAEPEKNEQAVANDLLIRDRDPIRWDYLPWSFYARTHGWPPPRRAVLYHANYTKGADGVGQKIAQFAEFDRITRGGLPARFWSCLKRLPGKARRVFGGRE